MLRRTANKMVTLLCLVGNWFAFCRDWVLFRGSRTVEVGNSIFMLLWGVAYALQKYLNLDVAAYRPFEEFDKYYWYWGMVVLAIAQGVLTAINSIRCNVLSGFLLVISCCIWTFIAVMLGSGFVVHAGVTTYAVIAVACLATGSAIMSHNDKKTPQYSSEYCSNQQCGTRQGWTEDVRRAYNGDKTTITAPSAVRNDGRLHRGMGTGKNGQGWIPIKRYFYRFWCYLRNGRK